MGELMEIAEGMNTTSEPMARPSGENTGISALAEGMMKAPAKECPHCGERRVMAVVQLFPFIVTEDGALRTPNDAERMLPDNLDFRCGNCEEWIRAGEVGIDPKFLMESTAQEFDLRMVMGGDMPGATLHVPMPDAPEVESGGF